MSYELRVAGCEQRQSSRFQLATRNSQPATSRPAFTMIELLVVIGIILILMGLFFAGAKLVTAQAKERDTKTMLETCKTMFENYRQATHLSRPPPAGPVASSPSSPLNVSTTNAWGTITTAQFWSAGEEAAPGLLSSDPSAYTNPSNLPEAVANTAYVMYALESIPENKTIINNLPISKIINVYIQIGPSGAFQTVAVPLIRDAWGNPILFVPGGGLGATPGGSTNQISPGVVWLDGANCGIITSNGVINSSSLQFATYDAANTTQFPVGSTNQPFFVSAGPDGDVSNAHGNTSSTPTSDMTDDNIYSFQN